jgi:hypothetical protein
MGTLAWMTPSHFLVFAYCSGWTLRLIADLVFLGDYCHQLLRLMFSPPIILEHAYAEADLVQG